MRSPDGLVDRSRRQWITGGSSVVGTYLRLLRQDIAEEHGGFYSARGFDISDLLQRHTRACGFSNSAVPAFYLPTGPKRAIELLWHGDVELCARTPYRRHDWLRKLGRNGHRAALRRPAFVSASFRTRARTMARGASFIAAPGRDEHDDERRDRYAPCMARTAPLIKGYLRVGAFVGDSSAVVDPQFGTTDVLVVLPVATRSTPAISAISERMRNAMRPRRRHLPHQIPALLFFGMKLSLPAA